jgi:hypothetical protein
MSKRAASFLFTQAKNAARHIDPKNRVILHFWSPGYLDRTKTFIPTSTFGAAMAWVAQNHRADVEKHKSDAHPGHVSLSTNKHYLSVGTRLVIASPIAEYDISFTETFGNDVAEFNRTPEQSIDFYSLKASTVNKIIQNLRSYL